MKKFKIISGYKFIKLDELTTLRSQLLEQCTDLELKGTLLLAPEGINFSLCGNPTAINTLEIALQNDSRFNDIFLQYGESDACVFKRMKVKIKKEIITFKKDSVSPVTKQANTISPQTLKTWLDEKRDFILLDSRNRYEIDYGLFEKARHLDIDHFVEFPAQAAELPKDKIIVTYCTGGIRCEKAALYLEAQGHQQVYQLQGGILNYFQQIGRDHYIGHCFVFDEREKI